MGTIRTRLQSLWWSLIDRVSNWWQRLRDLPGRRKAAGAGAVVVLVGAVVAVAVLAGPDRSEQAPNPARMAVVTNGDLPANLWTGWTETPIAGPPAVAVTPAGASAVPEACVPGGQLQQQVQHLGVDGPLWAGTAFVNVALGARAETMIAANDGDINRVVDTWSAACGQARVNLGESTVDVQVKQLPVNASAYRLKAARVVAQTVTPTTPNAEAESSTLTAVGRSGGYVSYVTLTFPGSVNDDAIVTLDTLWRAQAAKLIAYQQTGEL